MTRKPSYNDLMCSLKLTREQAYLIRRLIDEQSVNGDEDDIYLVMELANKLLDGYGVEGLDGNTWISHYWQTNNLLYVNKGDTYSMTLLYDTLTDTYLVGSWGDYVERHTDRFAA